MHFSTLLSLSLPLLSLALPIASDKRDFKSLGNDVANADLPAAEKGASGLGSALGSGSGVSTSSSGKDAGKQSATEDGSDCSDDSSSGSSGDSAGVGGSGSVSAGQGGGKNNTGSGLGSGNAGSGSGSNVGQGSGNNNSTGSATGSDKGSGNSAANAGRNRPCDQGDQSLQSGLQAMQTIHLGLQAAAKTLETTVSAKQISAADFKTNQARLQQFVDTANLQLQMADAIADEGSFSQPQLASLKKSLANQDTIVKGLKGVAGDAKTLQTLQADFKTATGVVQDAISNAVVDCFLPLHTVSG